MNDKFVHLEAPYGFKSFYSKYPEGYSIFEALLHWLDEVNKMIDTLNITLEEWQNLKAWVNEELKGYAEDQLIAWLNDGTLESIINQTLFNTKLDVDVYEADKILSEQELSTKLDINDYEIIESLKPLTSQLYFYDASLRKRTNIILLEINKSIKAEIKVNNTTANTLIDDEIVTNLGTFNMETLAPTGYLVSNGVVIHDLNDGFAWSVHVGFNEELRGFEVFDRQTPLSAITAKYQNVFTAILPIIRDGVLEGVAGNGNYSTLFDPRMVLAELYDGRVIIFHSGGREYGSHGLSQENVVSFLNTKYGLGSVKNAVHLDGGGSSQIATHGLMLTKAFDDSGTQYRTVPNLLTLNSPNSQVRQKDIVGFNQLTDVNYRIMPIEQETEDVNNCLYTGNYYVIHTAINKPYHSTKPGAQWFVMVMRIDGVGNEVYQIAFERTWETGASMAYRTRIGGTWSAWREYL